MNRQDKLHIASCRLASANRKCRDLLVQNAVSIDKLVDAKEAIAELVDTLSTMSDRIAELESRLAESEMP